jgi:hypothetical protein
MYDCGLDDLAVEVRSPADAKVVFLCVQIGSEAQPSSCSKSAGGKARPGSDADHLPLSSTEVMNE